MKQIFKTLSFIAFLFISVISFGQYKLTDPIPLDPNVKIGKLPNGLTYYIRKNVKPEKKVELRLAVNAGSVLENNDQRGLAHFMEHMGFNGSKNFPKNELVDYLQKSGVKFGADLNAYTGFDETVYILPIPTDDPAVVEKGFMVLEDWAFNNLFDKNEIEKERGVVLEESRLSKGSFERMSRQYFPKLFNGSKYAERLPIGTDAVLKNFKHETLKSFYKNWYRPNLMAVIVVGDIDPADAEKKIKAHFSKFTNPAGAPARPAITPIAQRTKPEAMVVTDEEATNNILQIFNFIKPARKIKTWADYRENLVEELISSLINQRLNELTQKADPPFVFGYTGYQSFLRGYNTFISAALLGDNPMQEAMDALIAETNRARQFGFLQSELDRVKAATLNGAEKGFLEKDKTQSGQIVGEYVQHYLNSDPIPGVEHNFKFLQQVLPGIKLEEINAAAKKMPSTANSFALLQAPTKMKDKLPTNDALLNSIVAANKKPVTAYEEKAIAASLLDKDPAPGKITAETKNEKLGTTDLTLSNGVTITIKPTQLQNDEIAMDAWRWGGYSNFDLADKDNAKSAAILVGEMGLKDMSPTDLQKFLAGKTIEGSPYINAHEEGIEGSSSVKDFETFLQTVYLFHTQPRKDEALFKSYISKNKSMLQFVMQNPQAWYADTLTKILYNNHPWADGGIPRPQDLDKLNLDKAFGIYQQIFGNAYGMHYTFVGNIDIEKAKPLLEKYIGSLPASPKENKYKDNGVRMVKGMTEANLKRGKESQSTINIFFEGETEYNRDDKLHLAALIEVLNIKIIEKLREEMSGIYGGGLQGNISKRPYVHYTITGRLPCGPENVEKLTNAFMNIIKEAQEKGIDQKDLDKVRETWKKQYHVNLQSNDWWLTGLSTAWIDQSNPEALLDYEKRVDALKVEDLQHAAKKFLTLNNMVKAVLYPESSTITPGVKTVKPF
jgi:zinc protease